MITDINSEDRLVQQTFAEHLEKALGWESVYAYNTETFGPRGTLGRASEREAVLVRDLRAALARLNPGIPESAREQAIEQLTRIDFARSLLQHNRELYGFIRGGVPVEWRDAAGEIRHAHARVIDFRNAANNRFLAVRELKIQGVRVPHYNRRGDLVCFINGLPLVFIELKAVYKNTRAGGTRKIVARNHQVLGVNRAVASVVRQEQLKQRFPAGERLIKYRVPTYEQLKAAEAAPDSPYAGQRTADSAARGELPLVKRAHKDLGRLGVFWHTQGSGKSYSMAFFTEKVRRVVPGNFTFVVMTDREDLDDQIWRTFIGCGVADETMPRPSSGLELKEVLRENHRFVFSLIHKFNQPVSEPYSDRDDIIVISDEAHRTQTGKFAHNMRLALPNASFIGFTGTPLFTHDHLTRRIFGGYVSRYDFKRSEQDQSTVKLVYENRGEKLGIARLDLNDRIAAKIEEAELDPDQTALLEKLLGQDYEVITADDRLDKLADDFVEHCSTRWETGKSMLICIDKVTCARMLQRIEPRWRTKLTGVKALMLEKEAELSVAPNADERERLVKSLERLRGQAQWMESTIVEIIISEAQNEVRDFARWGFDIRPHRMRMKSGFQTPDGRRMGVDDAFKDPQHPFRIAIICAMWLTGFDVECLSTLYIDKPMKAHTLMQAIARANRVYPGKDCGVIVDYNGMLKSLREALAQYALGDEDEGGDGGGIVAPIEELVAALLQGIEAAENHLKGLGFDA